MCGFHCGGELKPADIEILKKESTKACQNCAYYARASHDEPCNVCSEHDCWKAQCDW